MNGYEELAEARKWAETYAERMMAPVIIIAWPKWRSEALTGNARAWWARRPRMILLGFAAVVLAMLAEGMGRADDGYASMIAGHGSCHTLADAGTDAPPFCEVVLETAERPIAVPNLKPKGSAR